MYFTLSPSHSKFFGGAFDRTSEDRDTLRPFPLLLENYQTAIITREYTQIRT